MSESAYGAQVVEVLDDHTYQLHEDLLRTILLKDDIKDLPVVLVSVAGPYRRGKSFLLNFFLRYLLSPKSAQEDGSWIGEESEPLKGFSWRSGFERNTTGILLWSEPIVVTKPNGEKVAVLLMDTQGTFDNQSTVRDCSTIFAMSTLLSSVLVYNLFYNIQEDDLQHLQLFTEYGRLVMDSVGSKAFQGLQFLVRDWAFPDDFDFGAEGGELLLRKVLKIQPNMAQDMKDLRTHINSCFEKLSCFLMPHPGMKVLRKKFDGKISDIDPEFRTYLKELVKSIFSPENMMSKTINGELVRAKNLYTYFKTYMGLFNSNEVPTTSSIMEATVRAGMLAAAEEARAVYERGMTAECGPDQPSLPAYDLQSLHVKYITRARADFTSKKKMGTHEQATVYLDKLTEDLQKELPLYRQSNIAKTQEAVNRGNKAYEATVEGVTGGMPLCLHATDLLLLHRQAYEAAKKAFEASRRRITDRKDEECDIYLKGVELRLSELRKQNEQNHATNSVALRMRYWELMQAATDVDTPLSATELRQEHTQAAETVLREFVAKRNKHTQYEEDVFMYNFNQEISKTFMDTKKLNSSKNKAALKYGLAAYNEYMAEAWNQTEVLHPLCLKAKHEVGLCRALAVFRPRKNCIEGFDSDDSDEQILLDMINRRYHEMKNMNDTANESAAEEAFRFYYHTMEELCRPVDHTCYSTAKTAEQKAQYHDDTRKEAITLFLRKQREAAFYSTNEYKDGLEQKINNEYQKYIDS